MTLLLTIDLLHGI